MSRVIATVRSWWARVSPRVVARLGAPPPTEDSNDASTTGRWPTVREAFLWDLFLPDSVAPGSDGAKAPSDTSNEAHSWINKIPRQSLEIARAEVARARQTADADVAHVELKAGRLLQPIVTAVITAGAVVAFAMRQADRAEGWLPTTIAVIAMCVGTLAMVLLLTASITALGADLRVAFYADLATDALTAPPNGRWRRDNSAAQVLRQLIRADVAARELAGWSRKRKLYLLMASRAWFVRGLVTLLISGLLAGLTLLLPTEPTIDHVTVVVVVTPPPSSAGTATLSPSPSATASFAKPSVPSGIPSPSVSRPPRTTVTQSNPAPSIAPTATRTSRP